MRTVARVLFVCLLVLGVLAGLMTLAWLRMSSGVSRSKCSSNVRQMALGAVSYAGDKRFFPQLHRMLPDETAVARSSTEVARALIWGGYLDSAEVFVCPQSEDRSLPLGPGFFEDHRRWFWGGQLTGDPNAPPGFDDLDDPQLVTTSELSYGWTRKPMNTTAGSSNVLAGDRAIRRVRGAKGPPGEVGNHWGGIHVVHVDAATRWTPAEEGRPLSPELLALEGRLDDLTRAPIPEPRPGPALAALATVAWLSALVAAFVFGWVRRAPQDGDAPD